MATTEEVLFSIEAKTINLKNAAAEVEKLLATLQKAGGKSKFTIPIGVSGIQQTATAWNKAAGEQKNYMAGQAKILEGTARLTNAQTKLATAQTRAAAAASKAANKAKMDLGSLGDQAERMASRFQFLFSALIAGFAFDVLTNAAQDFVKLEGAIRGIEMASARAGVSGKKMFDDLTSGVDGFKFKAQEAADAVNKILLGGLKPTGAQMKQAGQMAAGASIMLGEDPSKMLKDLATAALRVSYRMADNLGIIVRANDAYKAYGASIGKAAKDLTGLEKVQAFWNAMLNSSGAKMLTAASALDTLQMKFQRAKVTLNEFYLALGENIAKSIIPFADALNSAGKSTIETAAHWTILIAKSAMLAAGITMVTRAIQGFTAASTAAKAASLWLLALQAAVIAVSYAMDQYDDRQYKANQLIADATQLGIMYQQTMASLGVTTQQAAMEQNELLTALNGIGASSQVISYFEQFKGAIDTAQSSIQDFIDNTEEVSPAMQDAADKWNAALDDVKKKLIETAKESKTSNEAMAKAQKLAVDEMDKAMKGGTLSMAEAMGAQAKLLNNGLTKWQAFYSYIGQVSAAIADAVINMAKAIGNGFMAAVSAVGAGIAAVTASAMNGLVNLLNKGIDAINSFSAKLGSSGIGKFLTGLGISTGSSALLGIAAAFSGGKQIGHIGAKFGAGGGMTAAGLKANYDAALTAMGATGFAGAASSAAGKFRTVYDPKTGKRQPALPGSLQDQVGQYWSGVGEAQLDKRNKSLLAMIDEVRKQMGFTGIPVEDGGGKKGGGGGGGKKQKDLYAEAVEKLKKQLEEIDLQNKQLAEIYPIQSEQRRLEEKKLAEKQDQALLDFEITAKQEKFYDKFAKQEPLLVKEIAQAKERTRLSEEINKKFNEAVKTAQDNLKQAQTEHDLRKQLGMKVDEAALSEKKLDEAIKLSVDQAIPLAEAFRQLNLTTQDLAGIQDKLKSEAQKALGEAQKLRLDWDLSQLDYRNQLMSARESDPNRQKAMGLNAIMDEFERRFADIGKTKPATEEAMNLVQSLQKLQIEAEQTATDMEISRKKGKYDVGSMLKGGGAEQVKSMLAGLEQMINQATSALNPEGYVVQTEEQARAAMIAAENFNTEAVTSNTSALSINTSALLGLPGALGSVMAGIASALANAAATTGNNLNAAASGASAAIQSGSMGTGIANAANRFRGMPGLSGKVGRDFVSTPGAIYWNQAVTGAECSGGT
jgi:hypothetical protein